MNRMAQKENQLKKSKKLKKKGSLMLVEEEKASIMPSVLSLSSLEKESVSKSVIYSDNHHSSSNFS